MGRLAVLGSNGFHTPGAEEMHREILSLSGMERPDVLLIALASGDNDSYIRSFERLYHGLLGCKVETLPLRGAEQLPADTAEKFERASVIFLGGGENVSAVAHMKRQGLWAHVGDAYRRGAVLAGEGLGASFLFEGGYAFELSGIGMETPILVTVQGFGLIEGFLCTGCERAEVAEGFSASMLGESNTGFALTSSCALFVCDDLYYNRDTNASRTFSRVTACESFADYTNIFTEQPLPLSQMYADPEMETVAPPKRKRRR